MNYSFDVEIAKEYGLDEAVMIENFRFWILKNKANAANQIAGHTWTYNSIPAFVKLFPFWTEKQIRRILDSLFDQGVLIHGRHGENKWDRKLWYAFKNECKMLGIPASARLGGSKRPERLIDETEQADGIAQTAISSIADNKPDNKPDKTAAKTPQAEFIEYYVSLYKKRYNKELAYKFEIKDYVNAAKLIKGYASETLRRAAELYLADNWAFQNGGHTFGSFVKNKERWITAAGTVENKKDNTLTKESMQQYENTLKKEREALGI